MKTSEIFAGSSTGYKPGHTLKPAAFNLRDGVYPFYDDKGNILHAIAITPGLFVRTVED
jgi:hypothetical protein